MIEIENVIKESNIKKFILKYQKFIHLNIQNIKKMKKKFWDKIT
jgi:hypothetical protein